MKQFFPSSVFLLSLCIIQACCSAYAQDVDPTPSPTFKCPEEEGLYPNPTDCSKFYQCFNHVAWAGQCPANLYFNPSLKVCDFPEKVDCHQDFARLVHETRQKPSSGFLCPSISGLFPVSPGACVADYYMCVSGYPYPQMCPANLIFDPVIRSCQALDKTSCAQTTIHPTQPTSPPPFRCPASSGSFPISPYICERDYYMCVDYTPYLMSCPGNLIFDPVIDACQSADRSSCGPTTVPKTTPSSKASTTPYYPTTSHPFKCPQGNDIFPKPGNCRQFILCSNGIPNTMNCPSDLYYNPATKYCDYADSVDCHVSLGKPDTNVLYS